IAGETSLPIALLALAIAAFGIGTTEFVMMGLLPEVASDLGATIPQAGGYVSLYALGVVVGAPVLTMLGMRSRRKAILLNMLVLFTAGNLFSALAPTHELLLAARFIAGLPHGVFFGIGAVVAANLVTQDKRAQAISMMFIGLTVANIVGVPAGTLLGQQLGWRWSLALVALIGVVALGAVAALVPNQPKPENVSVRGELRAFRRPQVWLAFAVVVFGFAATFSFYSYNKPVLTDVTEYTPGAVTVLLEDKLNRFYSPFSGGSRVLVDGLISERAIKKAIRNLILVCSAIAVLVAYLSPAAFYVPMSMIAVLFIVAISYTASPLKFSYNGWGGIVVGFTHSFAVVVCGFVFQRGNIGNVSPWILGLPLFLSIIPAIIMSGIPGFYADKQAGKGTLAVRLGKNSATYLAGFFVLLSIVLTIFLKESGYLGHAYGNVIYLALLHALLLLRMLYKFIRTEKKPNRIDGIMAISLLYIMWFALVPFVKLI